MAYIRGTGFSEDIDGTNGNDTIEGFGGDDVLYGFGGNDTLYGGSGDDDLWGGTGINNLYGGSGRDYFVMSARTSKALSDNYIADFSFGDDKIDVSAWGASDFTQIQMLLRDDRDGALFNAFYGGKNNIVQIADVDADELESSDFAFSKAGGRDILGTSKGDVLFGSRSSDVIEGGSGNDILLGGQGNDTLYGDSGNDRIYGGRGQDFMTGNSGRDVFVFAFANETAANSKRDVIRDFTLGVDTIDVSLIDARPKTSGNQEFEWIGRDSFDGVGQLRYSYSGNNTIVSGNIDNDRDAEFQIALNGKLKLVADDFFL